MTWRPPDIQVLWGNYFKPDPEEQQKIIELAQVALGKGGTGTPLITLRKAVEKIASIFGIDNIDSMVEQLEAQTAERERQAMERLTAEASALHGLANDDRGADGGGGARGRGDAPSDDGRGSGGATVAPSSGRPAGPGRKP